MAYRYTILLIASAFFSVLQGCNSAEHSTLPIPLEPVEKVTTYSILPVAEESVEKDCTLIITGHNQPDTIIGIEQIDKEQVRGKKYKNSAEYKLAPGRHTVFYYFIDKRYASVISSADLNISFLAKAGHSYELRNYIQWDGRFPEKGDKINFLTMVINTTEGNVVAWKKRGEGDFKEKVLSKTERNQIEWTEKKKIRAENIDIKKAIAVTLCDDEFGEQNECHLNSPYDYIPLDFLNRGNQFGFHKAVFLDFVYKGNKYGIYFNVSRVAHEKLFSISQSLINSKGSEKITKKDFILPKINNQLQREKLLPLVEKIRSLTPDVQIQARIAISLVQNIPYGFPTVGGSEVNYEKKYPYGVIWERKGICDEKSDLLLFLLKELGFGTAALIYKKDFHRAVGVKCPNEYDVDDSGFCYVEVTTPRIITDNMSGSDSSMALTDPEIIKISDGIQLEGVEEEFKDKKLFHDLINNAKANNWLLEQNDYDLYNSILNKYGIEGNKEHK